MPGRQLLADVPLVWLFYLLAGLALGVFAWGLFLRLRPWRGAAADRRVERPGPGLGQALAGALWGRPIFRGDLPAGLIHLCLAWGFGLLFLGTLGLAADAYLIGWLNRTSYPVFSAVLDGAGLLLLAGVLASLIRRGFKRPARLANRAQDVLILIGLGLTVLSGLGVEAGRLAGSARPEGFAFVGQALAGLMPAGPGLYAGLWWSHALVSLALIAWLPFTKLTHALAGPVQLFYQAQPRRGLSGEAALTLGRGEVLAGAACTFCGRCEAACPVFGAGQDFSPRRFIASGGVAADLNPWACATCLACLEACPLGIDPPQGLLRRRGLIVESGHGLPPGGVEALESLAKHANPWGVSRRQRSAWSREFRGRDRIPTIARLKEPVELLYFVGCTAAIETRAQGLAKSLARLLKAAGVGFAVLGDEEPCCGDAARQWGEVGLFELLFERTCEALNQAPVREVVCSSPHCLKTFRDVYPLTAAALGRPAPELDFRHYSQVLARLLDQGRLKPWAAPFGRVTFHDPCYLGRGLGEFEAPRRVLKAVPGLELVEMAHHGRESLCCGGGGGRMWQDFSSPRRPAEIRLEEALAVGAEALVTACPFCLIMLEDGLKTAGLDGRLKVIDLAELLWLSLGL